MARRRWENYGTPVHIEEIGRTPYNKLSKEKGLKYTSNTNYWLKEVYNK